MDRKEIVKALEEHNGVKAKYMGTPSFAYQITVAEETYTIDRNGSITTAAGVEVEVERLLAGSPEEAPKETGPTEFEVEIPMGGHTGATLRNLVNMIYSKQFLIRKAFELEDGIVKADFIAIINRAGIQTLDDFKTVVEENSCPGINFNFLTNSIIFKFCENPLGPEKLEAYTQFVSLLNKSAKAHKYASPKPTDTDNEKFTMRTWLIRLGFIGTEYKKARKILLQNLAGNCAFRKVKPSEKVIAEQ